MISFENWTHGFLITIAGHRLLWHTTRRPAVFIHRAGEMASSWRGAGALHSTRASVDGTLCTFTTGLGMRESLVSGPGTSAIYSLRFFATDPQIDALRVELHDIHGARWSGLGPRENHHVRGKIVLQPDENAVAFTLDGRFLHCVSKGTKTFNFSDARIAIDVQLPAILEFGYAASTEAACKLWHVHRKANLKAETEISAPHRQTIASKKSISAAGMLGSLSFSGAAPISFQNLNRELAEGAQGELIWKIVDMLLCQPDIVLPAEYRRELPGAHDSEIRTARARNRYSKIRAGLAQYWDVCERHWQERGLPALAHPSIMRECGVNFDDRDDMLFSGPDLLFAPNLTRKGELCELELPSGEWVHLWTSRRYYGGKTTVFAPKGNPALFYRSESEFAWLFDSIRQMASRL